MKKIYYFVVWLPALFIMSCCNAPQPLVRGLILTERGGQHGPFTDAAMEWLDKFAEIHHFEFTEINSTDSITEKFLDRFDVFIQLDFPPYTWTPEAQQAFIRYIEEGRGGWVGFHHATLLGDFDGYPMWTWFSEFMGGIRFQHYIAATASATVQVEDPEHPVMKNVSGSFVIPDDEWYTFNRSPHPNVRVLASVDESSYEPASDITMGDHPVIWCNEQVKARNVYFLMGHSPRLFETENFVILFSNALLWASQ